MPGLSALEIAATICFVLALLHTFSVKKFQHIAHSRFKEGSVGENFFHLLGEVEVVFGLWAAVYILIAWITTGSSTALARLESLNFTEPLFVFVIMVACATKPVLTFAEKLIEAVAKLLPLPAPLAFYITTLILGPLLGSFITEPAAMTVTALTLLNRFYDKNLSPQLRYATIGLLFVNVSIGGTLTPYAAPPVLMVASTWGWDLSYMLSNFGWRGAIACALSTLIIAFRHRIEIKNLKWEGKRKSASLPAWVVGLHLLFVAGIVMSSHHPVVFVGLFLFFIGLTTVTREYQTELKLKEGLLVGFFLAGLVVLGGPQKWWLQPVLQNLSDLPLYLSAMGLTAVVDNAAITYLGSLVEGLSDSSKYYLVAGSVVGGGLTVIANAPNPAGYGILNASFGEEGISPIKLFVAALIPTFVAAILFLPRFS